MQSILDLNYLKSKYEAIGTDATGNSPENEAFLVDKEQSRTPEQTSPRPRRLTTVTALNILLLIISVSILVTSFKKERQLLRNENNSLLKAIDSYSPVYDKIDVKFVDVTINGSLLNRDKSIYRQPPSPEVDAAWERITHQLPHAITAEDVRRLGKDPSRTAKWPEDWGFGPDAYIAELDIIHTVHCLNAVRRDIHWRHYFGDKYPDGIFPELHRVHTDHCIYIILQNLMCSANGDIITNVWVETQDHPFPDFNVNKRCRDYNAFVDWHHENQIEDMEKYSQMRIPEGEEPWKMSEEFHQLFQTGLRGTVGNTLD